MKQVTLSAQQLLSFEAPVYIHNEDTIKSVDDIYQFGVGSFDGTLAFYKRGYPLVLSPTNETGAEFRPRGSFAGRVAKVTQISQKATAVRLAVYCAGAKDNTIWIDCIALNNLVEVFARIDVGTNMALEGGFEIENHETFGVKMKLFVQDFSFLGGGRGEKTKAAPAAKQAKAVQTEELPF